MKKFLLLTALVLSGLIINMQLIAQCTVTNLAVELKSKTQVGDSCLVVFDFSWDQDINHGNKFAFIHLWNVADYPNLDSSGEAYSPTSSFPDGEDLALALGTIVIDSNFQTVPHIGTTYYPDESVPVLIPDTVIKSPIDEIWERMTVKNITLYIPSCSGSRITGDIWASQAENGHNVHCVSAGVSIVVGNPFITGLMNCNIPRTYNTSICNVGFANITSSYNVFIDIDNDAVYEPADDIKITTDPIGPYVISPGTCYNSVPALIPTQYLNYALWIEVTTVDIPNKTIYRIENTCAALPVSLQSFTARRDNSNILLQWETVSEVNNSGFEIQRKIGAGRYETVSFVFSQALGGNSQSLLVYNFTDFNPAREMSEYRLKEINLDGRPNYSETRFVRGTGQKTGIMILPNPSPDGQVTVLFEDVNAYREVSLLDANGKQLKQWHQFANNSLRINNLATGIYCLQIIDQATRQKRIEKFVVINQ